VEDGKRAVTGSHFQTNVFTMVSKDHNLESAIAKLNFNWDLFTLFG
jgi:hypothetical protein